MVCGTMQTGARASKCAAMAMAELIESGSIIDLMLVFVLIEVAALMLYWRLTGKGIAPVSLLLNAGAGTSLMLALRAALTGAPWQWLAAWLAASLVFHVVDLAARWPRAGSGTGLGES